MSLSLSLHGKLFVKATGSREHGGAITLVAWSEWSDPVEFTLFPGVEQHDALVAVLPKWEPPKIEPELGTLVWHDEQARAALRSLLPPSPAMIEAAARSLSLTWDGAEGWWMLYRRRAELALTAAIRAALGDEG